MFKLSRKQLEVLFVKLLIIEVPVKYPVVKNTRLWVARRTPGTWAALLSNPTSPHWAVSCWHGRTRYVSPWDERLHPIGKHIKFGCNKDRRPTTTSVVCT